METDKPSQMPAGPALDALIHTKVMGLSQRTQPPAYSTDIDEASKVKDKLQSGRGISIVYGLTPMPDRNWFARCALPAGSQLEVLANTYPLAICRFALAYTESQQKPASA
jgi:hypothetical protein